MKNKVSPAEWTKCPRNGTYSNVTETFASNLISALPALRLPHAHISSSRLDDATPSVVLYHHSDKYPTGEGSIPSGGKRDQNNYRDKNI